jgi:hypothetical protein
VRVFERCEVEQAALIEDALDLGMVSGGGAGTNHEAELIASAMEERTLAWRLRDLVRYSSSFENFLRTAAMSDSGLRVKKTDGGGLV